MFSEHTLNTPPPKPTPSTRRNLIALNAVLLLALGAVTLAPSATAQNRDAGLIRARGEYTVVGGEVNGATSNAIYVIDATNREMVGLLWDDSRRQIKGMGYRDLAMDLLADPER